MVATDSGARAAGAVVEAGIAVKTQARAVELYRKEYSDLGPTLAAE